MLRELAGLAAAACLLAAVSAGCASPEGNGTAGEGPPPAPAGRYLEEAVALPPLDWISAVLPEDGGAWTFYGSEGETYTSYRFEAGTYTKQEVTWLSGISGYVNALCQDADGGILALYETRDEGTEELVEHLARVDAQTGALAEQAVEWEKAKYINGLLALPGGGFLTVQQPQGAVIYGADGAPVASLDGFAYDAALWEGRIALAHAGQIDLYDPATGDQGESIPAPESANGWTKLAVYDSTLYLCCDTGLFRYVDGEWERLVDGGYNAMSAMSYRPMDIRLGPDRDFYVLYSQNNGLNDYKRYHFSADAPAEPEFKLRVASLEDNLIVPTVIKKLREEGIYVKMDTYWDKSGAMTARDAIKTINTELLAGKGADIYILDGMPIGSYIEKQVLLDIADVVAPRVQSGEWMENAADTFKRGDAVYAIPVRYGIPTMWGGTDFIGTVRDVTELADWAQAHPKKPLFFATNLRDVLSVLYTSCGPFWLDEAGDIRQDMLAEFLDSVKRIMDTIPEQKEPFSGYGGNGDFEAAGMFTDKNQIIVREVKEASALAECNYVVSEKGGGGFAPLAGQGAATYTPRVIAGINGKCADVGLAKRFLEMLLSEEIQDITFENYQGLPVNRASLEKSMQWEEGRVMGYGMDDGLVTTEQKPLDDAMKDSFLALCGAANVPSLEDPVLFDMLIQGTADFFAGNGTARETASAVAASMQAYLDE